MTIVVADLVAQLRVDDDGVDRSLTRAQNGFQRINREARTAGGATRELYATRGAAYQRAQAAAARLTLAEQKLAQAQQSGTASAQDLLRLEAAVRSARASSISTASRYASAQQRITAANNDVARSAENAAEQTSGLSRVAGTAMSALGKTLKIGAATAGVGAGATLAKSFQLGLGRLTAIDDAEGKLRGLGRSAQGIETIMDSALASVKGTAYGLGDAATIAAGAVAAGIKPGKDLTTYLSMTADAASVAGSSLDDMGSIMNQVQTGQKAYTDDLNQLADRGIPIYQWLAAEMGVAAESVKDLASEGKVSSENFFDAIKGNISGAALEAGSTARGSMENLAAAVGRVGAAALSPSFSRMPSTFKSLTQVVDTLTPKVKGLAEKLDMRIFTVELPRAQEQFSRLASTVSESVRSSDLAHYSWETLVGTVRSLVADAKVAGPAFVEIGQALAKASGALGLSTWQVFLSLLQAATTVLNVMTPALDGLAGLMSDNHVAVTALVAAFLLLKTVPTLFTGLSKGLAGVSTTAENATTRTRGLASGMNNAGLAVHGLQQRMTNARAATASFSDSIRSAYAAGAIGASRFDRLSGAANVVSAGMGRVRSGAMGVVNALGGPIGLAFTGAAIAGTAWAASVQKQKQYTDQYAQSLKDLAEEQKNTFALLLTTRGSATDKVYSSLTSQVDDYRQSVESAAKADAKWHNVASDIFGDTFKGMFGLENDNISDRLDDAAGKAQVAQRAFDDLGLMSAQVAQKVGGTKGDWDTFKASLLGLGEGGRTTADEMQKLRDRFLLQQEAARRVAPGFTELQTAMQKYSDSTATAADKSNALKAALDQLNPARTEGEALAKHDQVIRDITKATQEAIDQTQGFGAELLNLDGSISTRTANGDALRTQLKNLVDTTTEAASTTADMGPIYARNAEQLKALADQHGISVAEIRAAFDTLGGSDVHIVADLRGKSEVVNGLGAIHTALRHLEPGQPRVVSVLKGQVTDETLAALSKIGFATEEIEKNGIKTVEIRPFTQEAEDRLNAIIAALRQLPAGKDILVNAPGGQGVSDLLTQLGVKVRNDNNKLVLVDAPNSPHVLSALQILGLAVRNDNNKNILVTANTGAAQTDLDNFIANNSNRSVNIQALVRPLVDPNYTPPPAPPAQLPKGFPKSWSNPDPQPKATGGPIVGPGTGTSDDVPLWGSNGEFMIKAAAVRRYGLPFMHAVNAQRLATGGPVGAAPAGGGDQAAVTDPGTATVAVPGMGLPAALGQVADTVTAVKDSQLDPAMTEATAGVTEYGLATREQTAAVQAAWTATGSAVTTAAGTVIGPAVRGVGQVAQSTVAGMVAPALAGMRSNVAVTAAGVQTAAAGQINPAIASVGSTVQGVHAGTVDPVLAAMRGAVGNTAASFGTGAAAIASQWNSVREATAAPVRFTIGTVFNNGLVGMWNSVADLIGTSKMNPYPLAFASGGVMPGYTPGRDVHHFASPTGGRLALSGGEAFMVPEWTRAVGGPSAVAQMNAAARSGRLRRVPKTDQYLGGDMAFASGGTVQGGAEITSDIQRTMWDAVRTAFPNVVLTSGTRYADVGSGFDNHMGQRALDLGGPMPEIARWIYQLNRTQPVEELIHAPLQGWQNLKSGQPLNYGAGTDADHYDHVHWAMAAMRSFAGRLVSMAGGSGGAPAMQKSMATVIEETLTPLRAQVEKSMGDAAFGGRMGQVPRGVFAKMNEAMTARLRDLATKYMGPAIGGGGGDVERWRPMVIAALRRNGFDPNRRNQDLMLAQIQSESGGNPGVVQGVQDVNSGGNEAVSLLQVIPGTFESNRDPSLPNDRTDPWANMNAALRYYRRQYGDDLGAMWGKGHGYAQGGTIPGTGNRDTVPILATPGEEVIRKGPAEKNRPMLKKINEGGDVRVFVTNWPAGAASASTTSVTATPALPAGTDPSLTATVPPVDTGVPASEVTADENKVAEAKRNHQEATDRVALAERKLEEVRANPKAKASQRQSAEQAVVKAKNDVTAATEKLRQAERKLDETRTTATTPGAGATTTTTTGTTPPQPPTAFEFTLRNPFQPFWFKGEKEYQERIIARARELEQAEQERYGAGAGTGDTTTLSSMLGTENAVAERKRVLDEAEGKLRIAQMKLDEVQGSKNPKPSQIEKARQDITRAENDVTKAKEDLAVAEQKLAENQAKPIKQPAITKMWVGGTVPGTGMSDTVPALLTPGEEVTRRAMAIKHRRLLKAINADKVARYASGGTAGFGGYSADDRDYMKPTSLTDWLALGVGGASSVASMVAPYAQMVLSGQVDLGNALPQLNTGANDPSGGFATSVVSDFASQISQQLNELIRAVKEGQDVHVTVQNDQSPSAAGLVGMSMGV